MFMVFPMKCIKTAQYHDATNHMRHLNFSKTAQYHDATNNMRHLIFSRYFPWKSPKRLSTMMLEIQFFLQFSWYFPWNASKRLSTTMLQMTCSISIFPWYLPWISPKQLSTMMLQMTRVISFFHGMSHEIHQNGSVPRSYKWQRLSQFFMVIPMEFTKAAQYHNATNDARYLFSWYFPCNPPTRLSTMMLQITRVI